MSQNKEFVNYEMLDFKDNNYSVELFDNNYNIKSINDDFSVFDIDKVIDATLLIDYIKKAA